MLAPDLLSVAKVLQFNHSTFRGLTLHHFSFFFWAQIRYSCVCSVWIFPPVLRLRVLFLGRPFLVMRVQVLPLHFRHNKLTSFQRQLNLYGFQRIAKGSEAGRYKHEQFMRGRPEAAAQIRREAKDELGNRVRPGGFTGRSSGGGFGGAGGVDDGGSDGEDTGDDYLASLRAQPPRPGGRSGTRGHSHAAMASHQGGSSNSTSTGPSLAARGERSLRHAPSSRRSFGGGAGREEGSHSPEAQPRYAPDPEEEAEDDRSAALAMLNIARSLSTESLKPEPLSPAPNEADTIGNTSAAGSSSSSGFGEGGFSVGGGSFCEDRIDLVAALNASKSREAELSAQVERLQAQVARLEATLRGPTSPASALGGETSSSSNAAAAVSQQAHGSVSDGGSEDDEEKGGDSDNSSAGEKRRWRMDTNEDHSEASDDHHHLIHLHSGAGAGAKGEEARKRVKEQQSGSPPPSPGDSSGSAGSMPSPLSSRSTSDRCLSPALAEPPATAQAASQ